MELSDTGAAVALYPPDGHDEVYSAGEGYSSPSRTF
jgi:hypothetical protein